MHKNHYTLTANPHILAYTANSKEFNVGNINEQQVSICSVSHMEVQVSNLVFVIKVMLNLVFTTRTHLIIPIPIYFSSIFSIELH